MSRIFGAYRQSGYVVPDLGAAIARWARLGVGPFFRLDNLPLSAFFYAGSDALPALNIALGNFGDVQVELIEPTDTVASPYADFLAEHPGGGLHHISVWSNDFDADLARWARDGLEPDCTGEVTGVTRFAYFGAAAADGTTIEVADSAAGGAFVALSAAIRDAALRWDGADPARDAHDLLAAPPPAPPSLRHR